MPSAAPGEITRWAVRRGLPDYQLAPVDTLDRRSVECLCRWEMETCFHPYIGRFYRCGAFTQPLCGVGLERGRLGEVVSLVGDCRPPPPGNPRRPPQSKRAAGESGGTYENPFGTRHNGTCSSRKLRKTGGNHFLYKIHFSFKHHEDLGNLKILNSSEYFKIICSYYYCTGNQPVLKSGSFRSHLCGFEEAELPSIAITYVLRTKV
jgi:hypothetical protein